MSTADQPAATRQSPKEQMITILQNQPADSSCNELLNALVIDQAIDRGLQDVDAGRAVSNKEALLRIKSWRS